LKRNKNGPATISHTVLFSYSSRSGPITRWGRSAAWTVK